MTVEQLTTCESPTASRNGTKLWRLRSRRQLEQQSCGSRRISAFFLTKAEETQPILALGLLTEAGLKVTWQRDVKGNCPYLDETMGMTLLRDVEENQKKKAACLRTLTSGESGLSIFPLKFLEKVFNDVPAKEVVSLVQTSWPSRAMKFHPLLHQPRQLATQCCHPSCLEPWACPQTYPHLCPWRPSPCRWWYPPQSSFQRLGILELNGSCHCKGSIACPCLVALANHAHRYTPFPFCIPLQIPRNCRRCTFPCM